MCCSTSPAPGCCILCCQLLPALVHRLHLLVQRLLLVLLRLQRLVQLLQPLLRLLLLRQQLLLALQGPSAAAERAQSQTQHVKHGLVHLVMCNLTNRQACKPLLAGPVMLQGHAKVRTSTEHKQKHVARA